MRVNFQTTNYFELRNEHLNEHLFNPDIAEIKNPTQGMWETTR